MIIINNHTAPAFDRDSFHCPHCDTFAHQVRFETMAPGHGKLHKLHVTRCTYCSEFTYWFNKQVVIPLASSAPLPHEDMPESIIEDYLEAREIVDRSPRGATALLRLCLQKLMKELGEPGKHIFTDINSLVEKGLARPTLQALDVLRVIGNDAVHPGQIDMRDNQEVALKLFGLLNFIVEDLITRQKRVNELYELIPETKRIKHPESEK